MIDSIEGAVRAVQSVTTLAELRSLGDHLSQVEWDDPTPIVQAIAEREHELGSATIPPVPLGVVSLRGGDPALATCALAVDPEPDGEGHWRALVESDWLSAFEVAQVAGAELHGMTPWSGAPIAGIASPEFGWLLGAHPRRMPVAWHYAETIEQVAAPIKDRIAALIREGSRPGLHPDESETLDKRIEMAEADLEHLRAFRARHRI